MMQTTPTPRLSVSPSELSRLPDGADRRDHDCFYTSVRGTSRLDLRGVRRESFTEYHLTATVVGGGQQSSGGCHADNLLIRVAAELAMRRIQPIQEKFYGRREVCADVLRHREQAYRRQSLDPAVPVTWVEGLPLEGSDFVGVQIWGIVPHDDQCGVQTVDNPVTGPGRLWTGRGFEMLHLPAVRGVRADGTLPAGAAVQADQMFTNVGEGLAAHGMAYTDVARTWIYSSRLLDWYGDLNRVRNAHYKPAGLGVPGGPAFPASTGIQGRMGEEECMVDVLALRRGPAATVVAQPIRCSPRQDQSFNYGSAFSRGMVFDIEGRKTVHISGTASINTAGASTNLGNAEYQSLETLLCIAAILEEQGGSLHNITSATVFCKDVAAWEAWQRVSRLLQVPDFPKVYVLADVCRDDLLVEMESVSLI